MYAKAIDDYNESIRLNQNNINAYQERSDAYFGLAKQEKNKKLKAEYQKKAEEDALMVKEMGGRTGRQIVMDALMNLAKEQAR
jgi:predicted glycosyltransferase